MKIRYTGRYFGYAPLLHRYLKPDEEVDVIPPIGKQLIASGQFEEVKEKIMKKEVT